VAVHNKTAGIHLAAGAAWLVVLAALLFSGAPAHAQQDPRPLRARAALQQANEAYSRNEYEKAAKLCAQAQALQRELSDGERRDLDDLIRRNNVAVQGRKDGKELLNKADRALKLNRTPEATSLLNKAKANQYLAAEDQIRLSSLYDLTRRPTLKVQPPQPRTFKTILGDGRAALKAGDLDTAKQLALEAKRLEPTLIMPWSDRSAALLRDIEIERERRQKMMQTPVTPSAPPTTEKKSFLKGLFTLPGQSNPPNPPAGNSAAPPAKVSDNASNPDVPAPAHSVKNLLAWPFGGSDKDASTKQTNAAAEKPPIQTAAVQPKAPVQADQPVSVVSRSTAIPASPPSDPAQNTQQARQFVKQGYQALKAGDYENARKLAFQAQELRPDLEWWEMNPEKLLADIQRSAPAGSAPAVAKTPNLPAPAARVSKSDNIKGDPHALLKQARDLYNKKKLDEAERLCVQAAAAPGGHWGLFEDSPEKLRVDIQKLRTGRDREESARLLAEARKLYTQGNYQEAKTKAWRAQQLHGPYNVWDLGDRPQKVLADIERAERKGGGPTPDAKQNSSQAGGRDIGGSMASNNTRQTGRDVIPPLPTQNNNAAANEARARALTLMAEARDLQKRGLLVDARQRALAARELNVTFAPEGDSPDLVLQDLNLYCSKQIDALVQRADESASRLADSARFQKAEADLTAARALAAAFGQDVNRVDVKVTWLRQMQVSGGVGAPPPVQQTVASVPGLGPDMLDKARRELKAGNTSAARQLAVTAFDAKYGVQKDAEAVLREIDIEEHNQKILESHRNADAAIAAYKRRDFVRARAILAGVDVRLLNENMQNFVREMAASTEMGPTGVAVAKNETPVPPGPNAPGKSVAEDVGPGAMGSDFSNFRALEEVIYQKLLTDSREVQRKAINLVQNGEVGQAIDLLKDHLEQLNHSQLDPTRLALLRGQVDTRLQQYKTLQARATIDNEHATQFYGNPHNERLYQSTLAKNQQQVADMLAQYRELMKQGKYQEANLAALKAKELDPDNVAADAAIRISQIEYRQKYHDKIRDQNEERFWKDLEIDQGPAVDMDNPLVENKERLKVSSKRTAMDANGIWPKIRDRIERDIELKLSIPRTVNFKNTPLRRVIEDLHSLSGINIVPDDDALREQNISLDMPLSLSVENISMKNVLDLLLKQAHLTYVIRNQVLNVTTENNAKGRLKQVTYSVADLIVPVEEAPDVVTLDRVLDEYRARNATGGSTGNTPFLGVYSLPNGQTVSPQGSNAGSMAGTQAPPGVNTQSLTGKHSTRGTIEELLIDLITKTVAPDSWDSLGGSGHIQYFPLGMALVINQTQDVQEQIQELLQALRRLQDLEVAVELRMVSVSESFFERMGVDFNVNLLTHNSQANKNELVNSSFQPFGLPNQFQPTGFVSGLTPAGTFTPDLNIPIKTGSFGLSTPPFGGFPGTLGQDGGISLGLAFLSDIQVYMFMEAAQGDRRINVMQAPKVTVFNGQTAIIQVQGQQFFMINITPSFTPFGNLIFTPNNVPFPLGVTLRVTPVVSADRRFVRLNLVPTMTNLTDATVPLFPVQFPVPLSLFGPGNLTTQGPPEGLFQMFFQQPSFTSITVSTTVNVPDGGTVLMGGLKTLSEGRSEFGPPILSSIPYLNRLFKNVGYGREAQSLMLMVTPRIIINEEEEMIFRGQIEPVPRQ